MEERLLMEILINRYEKEFEAVQDVFELQVRCYNSYYGVLAGKE